jgi:GntR family transcriptional regulator/MocR family aminotransferase
VFYVGTFSKTLLPDLRLGYIVAPPWAMGALIAAKRCSDGWCSALMQATVALLIGEGHLARHVRGMHRIYGGRRAQLLRDLHRGFDRWLEPLPSMAGLHVAVRLRPSVDEGGVVRGARRHDVAVNALRPYYQGTAAMRGLLLGYGAIDEAGIAEGLARLRRAMPRP